MTGLVLQVPLHTGDHAHASVADIDGRTLRLAEFTIDKHGLAETQASFSPLTKSKALSLAAALKIIAESLEE